MDVGTLVIIGIIVIVVGYIIDKNSKMMKYRKLYDQALKEKNKRKALEYGRLYHRYRTNRNAKNTASAELVIANDMKVAGIE